MERSLVTSLALAASTTIFAVVLLFHSWQMHHTQTHILESTRTTENLQRTVARLQYQLETGGFAVAAASDGQAAGTQRGIGFSASEWESLLAPGNLLQPSTLPARVPGAQEGGTLRQTFITDIPGLNPLTQNAADVSELYAYVAEGIATQQFDDPDRWIPALAHRVEVNAENTQYRIFLKEGVLWHRPSVDDQDPRYEWMNEPRYLTADDFAFAIELIQNPQVDAAFLRNYYEDLESFEVINDHEFVMTWKEPLFHSLTFTLGLSPLPRWLYGADQEGVLYDDSEVGRQFNSHWYNQRAIGTGPYRFVSWEPGGKIRLERFDQYHGERPAIERKEFQVISDATARLNNLRSGDVDYVRLLPTQYRNEIQQGGTSNFQEGGNLRYDTFQGPSYFYLGWNSERPQFRDRRVRLAMTHAFDRQGLLDRNMHGLGRVVSGPFLMDSQDYNQALEPWPYDLERASELLTEAGWVDADGDGVRERMVDGAQVKFEFRILVYGHRPEFIAAMESFRNDLASIGVRMEIQPVEWAIMVERMTEKDFDAFTGGWSLSWFTDLYQIWHSSQADEPRGSNRVGFRHTEADALIEDVRRLFDPDERRARFHRFHEIVHEEQPYTFWYSPLDIGAWNERVEAVEFNPLRPPDHTGRWWIRN